MRRHSLVAIGAAAAIVAAAGVGSVNAQSSGATEQATPAVVLCKTLVYKNRRPEVYVTSARGLSCAAAAKEQRRYAWTGKNVFRTPGGFVCKGIGRGEVGYQLRCVKKARAYRLEFVD
jgi:hypothetical protein